MIAQITKHNHTWEVDYDRPTDCSIALTGEGGVEAWGLGPARIDPVREGGTTYAVSAGSPVNFFELRFSPHAHVTHTESIGHIRREWDSINRVLPFFRGPARLLSLEPIRLGNDLLITPEHIPDILRTEEITALVIRTLPNDPSKRSIRYGGTNPPYIDRGTMECIVESGIRHLLVDLPSVDREEDEGRLSAHRTFWGLEGKWADRERATITELIYVPDTVKDGLYWLELMVAPIDCDASPSRPVLYPAKRITT